MSRDYASHNFHVTTCDYNLSWLHRRNLQGMKSNRLSPVECEIDRGEMAEWSIATVLKTVVGKLTGGSNPSLSAKFRT